MRRWAVTTVLLLMGTLAGAAPPAAPAAVREFWVGAVPTTWNIVPNGRDAIMGTTFSPVDTVLPTTTYRRFSPGWRRALAPTQEGVQGPLLRARAGDRIRVHFKNMERPGGPAHSMHFHGVEYRPSSDGAYVPGVSGPDGNVPAGRTWTYELTAGAGSVGVWPYHDHSSSMDASIAGGMYGVLSIAERGAPLPDREFVVVFAPMGLFQSVGGRAFVGNTPVFSARVGELVQWDVIAMGSEHHTFHVHGHRWREPDGTPRDTQTVGPAESFRVRWREDAPGTWLYHCHVETHMAAGMIGTYRVRS